jgi:dTDP-4-dehydrorhamnose reductase
MRVESTPIEGLFVVALDVHGDSRGWFKENWQRDKMVAAGLPDFGPVQNNVSFNAEAGTIRGIHAEPWDKFVSVATGRAFGAWVDLREGDGFGTTFWTELEPGTAVFVPRGVANSFQVLEANTAYSYLVNDHWSADAHYVNVSLLDPELAIPWPLDIAEMSDKDKAHPPLSQVTPFPAATAGAASPQGRGRTAVIGNDGQLGLALAEIMPDARFFGLDEIDLTVPESFAKIDWAATDTVIVAAAYTAVDKAETPAGRVEAWQVNVESLVHLSRLATEHEVTLVNVSSDYVFDGTREVHPVDEPVSPLGVYGQTKAAGEAVTRTTPKHYLVRTSWVVGDGPNFLETMRDLARRGISPTVVDDQIGILTPASDLARGIARLLDESAPYGIYHVTGQGPARSWAQIAQEVFVAEGREASDVTPVTTSEYLAGRSGDAPVSPRPKFSTLG